MRIEKIALWLSVLMFLPGCAAQKAFLDLPAEQRQGVRFVVRTNDRPQVRFASAGAQTAREFGGIIPLVVSASIEHSTNSFGNAAPVIGSFESKLIQDLFVKKLRAASIDLDGPQPGGARLTLQLQATGLREVERERFVPFADAVGRLSGSDGKELWNAHVQSTGPHPRALQEFRERPELYRNDFDDVGNDLVNQLVEGPVRAVRF
jgi:hypothetical protein